MQSQDAGFACTPARRRIIHSSVSQYSNISVWFSFMMKINSFRGFSTVLLVLLAPKRLHGFVPTLIHQKSPFPSSSQLAMCICIDCARVTNCAAYHFVESKHEQPHMTENPTFEPREGSPTIHVNVRTVRDGNRQDEIARMWKEHKAETERAMKKSVQQGDSDELYGETKYDLTPVTTYEYDVVKCEDFVSDPGCWVRNMPEEIRIANPDFVPS
jgi:hypothetical protein